MRSLSCGSCCSYNNNNSAAMAQATGVSDDERLARLFCLGSDAPAYQVGDRHLTPQNASCVMRMLESGHGQEVVGMAIDYSVEGRAAKHNAIILAVAMCARQTNDPATRTYCYDHLCEVCRTPTQLFMFIRYCLSTGWPDDYPPTKWGPAFRRAICHWYLRFMQDPNGARQLAKLVTKYRRREGWSHQKVLRMAHPKAGSSDGCGVSAVLRYIAKGFREAEEALRVTDERVLHYLQAVEDVRAQTEPDTLDTGGLAEKIREHHLTREHVSTQLLKLPHIWEALLERMPMTAMIRNLGQMSAVGMLSPGSQSEAVITTRLGDNAALKNAKIHPFNVLLARLTYQRGQSSRRNHTWCPNEAVAIALDNAFYLTFSNLQRTCSKRFLLALDVSASMFVGSVNGCRSIQAGTAAAAMALATAKTERHHEIVSFSTDVRSLDIRADMTLTQVEETMKTLSRAVSRSTQVDCTLPIQYALSRYESAQSRQFDVIVVYTANKPDNRQVSPAEVMRDYRRKAKVPDAKLVVCAMKSNGFTIADPDDPNMLDVAGFDAYAAEVIRLFVEGEL